MGTRQPSFESDLFCVRLIVALAIVVFVTVVGAIGMGYGRIEVSDSWHSEQHAPRLVNADRLSSFAG